MILLLLFYSHIFSFIVQPITSVLPNSQAMMYTSVAEPMVVELKVSFYAALLLSAPVVMNRIWSFIKPGLKEKETIAVRKGSIVCFILFVIGVAFDYYVVVPSVVRVLIEMVKSIPGVIFMPKVGENISFVIIILLSFGLSFQIPIIMVLLDKLKIIPFRKQEKMWREYVVCIVIMSALITPPDAISMLFLAGPLVSLYVITIAYFKIKSFARH
jgi:sec-independent protein translocase protein TatC